MSGSPNRWLTRVHREAIWSRRSVRSWSPGSSTWWPGDVASGCRSIASSVSWEGVLRV